MNSIVFHWILLYTIPKRSNFSAELVMNLKVEANYIEVYFRNPVYFACNLLSLVNYALKDMDLYYSLQRLWLPKIVFTLT